MSRLFSQMLLSLLLCASLVHFVNSEFVSRVQRPVVVMHGLGEEYNDKYITAFIENFKSVYPDVYIVSAKVASGIFSYLDDMNEQVRIMRDFVKCDKNLAKGFNAVGISQGGLVTRGYIERFNDPPVHNFISLSGPQTGVSQCPVDKLQKLCEIMTANPYVDPLLEPSVTGYFRPIMMKASFIVWNDFLADINNDRDIKNTKYRDNMISLNKYVMLQALNDTVVIPKESEWHGYWEWGNPDKKLLTMRETDAYKGDWIGLRTLDEQGKLVQLAFEGQHCRCTPDWWNSNVMQYFNNYLDE